MSRIRTAYRHMDGDDIVVSQGIGDKDWGVYIVKPSGSLRRMKNFPLHATPDECLKDLDAYKYRRIIRLPMGVVEAERRA